MGLHQNKRESREVLSNLNRILGGAVLAIMVLLGGCTRNSVPEVSISDGLLVPKSQGASQASTSPAESAADDIPPGRFGRLVPSLSDLFSLTRDQQEVVWTAREKITQDCMAESGFDYAILDFQRFSDEGAPPMYDPFIGVVSAEYARKWGYHEDPTPTSLIISNSRSPDPSRDDPRGAAYYEALESVDGCGARAVAALEDDQAEGDAASKGMAQFKEVPEENALTDPRVVDAMARWTDCIRKAGYDFSSPVGAVQRYWGSELPTDPNTGESLPPPADEIDAAVADVDCKVESGLVEAYRVALWEAEQQIINENRPVFERYKQNELAQLARAQEILVVEP